MGVQANLGVKLLNCGGHVIAAARNRRQPQMVQLAGRYPAHATVAGIDDACRNAVRYRDVEVGSWNRRFSLFGVIPRPCQ
jgi:hypothetical protein